MFEKSSTWKDLETFMDELLNYITPGHHFNASIGDTMPPDANFDCRMYIGKRFEKDGGMPSATGSAHPMDEAAVQAAGEIGYRRAEAKRLREDLKAMVGGAPVNRKCADEVRADDNAPDTGDTVTLARALAPDADANSD